VVKNSPAKAGDMGSILVQEDQATKPVATREATAMRMSHTATLQLESLFPATRESPHAATNTQHSQK